MIDMSGKKVLRVFATKNDCSTLKPNELLTLVAITGYEHFGSAWNVNNIVSATGVPDRTVRDVITRLEDEGYLVEGRTIDKSSDFVNKRTNHAQTWAGKLVSWNYMVPRLSGPLSAEDSYIFCHMYHYNVAYTEWGGPTQGWSLNYLKKRLNMDRATIKKAIVERLGPLRLLDINGDNNFRLAHTLNNEQMGYFQDAGERLNARPGGGGIVFFDTPDVDLTPKIGYDDALVRDFVNQQSLPLGMCQALTDKLRNLFHNNPTWKDQWHSKLEETFPKIKKELEEEWELQNSKKKQPM